LFFNANLDFQARLPTLAKQAQVSSKIFELNPDSLEKYKQAKQDRLKLHQAWFAAIESRREVVRVPGDGDCLFYAIAANFPRPVSWEYLRAATIGFLRCNPEWPSGAVILILQ
jgi:hypothetical protein